MMLNSESEQGVAVGVEMTKTISSVKFRIINRCMPTAVKLLLKALLIF